MTFDPPLSFYVENFLGFPVGANVPTGYYDRALAAWVPSVNGRVVQVLSIGADGLATFDDANTWERPWTFGMQLTRDDTQPVLQ